MTPKDQLIEEIERIRNGYEKKQEKTKGFTDAYFKYENWIVALNKAISTIKSFLKDYKLVDGNKKVGKKAFNFAINLAKQFGIKVIITDKINAGGHYEWGKKIEIHPKKGDAYSVLHELGHVLTGYGCCREHDEFKAHGVAIGLSKAFNIHIPKRRIQLIDVYAGRSSHKACGAIEDVKSADDFSELKIKETPQKTLKKIVDEAIQQERQKWENKLKGYKSVKEGDLLTKDEAQHIRNMEDKDGIHSACLMCQSILKKLKPLEYRGE